MNRDLLKKAIKKLVLQEITNNQFGTPDHTEDTAAVRAAEKAVDKDGRVVASPGTGKTVGDSAKHRFALSKQSDNKYNVVSITNESERKTAVGLSLEDAIKFVKDHEAASKQSYVEKARAKSVNGSDGIKEDSDEEQPDTMEETDEDTQIEIADDNTTKREEKVDKKLAPVGKDDAAPKGGKLADKVERVEDRIDDGGKAEAKTAHLKVDSKMKSPSKLVVKDKGTPALKGGKK
jgi:hypothetical protein